MRQNNDKTYPGGCNGTSPSRLTPLTLEVAVLPIKFKTKIDEGYYISKWEGVISDEEIVDSYKQFYEGPEWIPGFRELVDLSQADMVNVSIKALTDLQQYTERFYKSKNISDVMVAVYCKDDLPYGLARMYQSWTDKSIGTLEVFRDLDSAKDFFVKKD